MPSLLLVSAWSKVLRDAHLAALEGRDFSTQVWNANVEASLWPAMMSIGRDFAAATGHQFGVAWQELDLTTIVDQHVVGAGFYSHLLLGVIFKHQGDPSSIAVWTKPERAETLAEADETHLENAIVVGLSQMRSVLR